MTTLVYQNWNREDGLMAEIFSTPEGYTLFCKDYEADEVFATFKAREPKVLVEKAKYFLNAW